MSYLTQPIQLSFNSIDANGNFMKPYNNGIFNPGLSAHSFLLNSPINIRPEGYQSAISPVAEVPSNYYYKDPEIVRKQQLMMQYGYNPTGGADGIWGNSSKAMWAKFMQEKPEYWMTHNEDGTEKKYTNLQLVDMSDPDAAYLTEAGKKARLAALNYLKAGQSWTVGGKNYAGNYAGYKAAVATENAAIAARNKAAQDKALVEDTNRWLANLLASGISQSRARTFANMGEYFAGNLSATDLKPREWRKMQRMWRRDARKGYGDTDKDGNVSFDERKAYYAKPSNKGAALESLITLKPEVAAVDMNKVSYKKGGLISYSQYLNK